MIKQTKFKDTYRIESTRLKKFDYSSNGAYFITICTKNREHSFGEIIDEKLEENKKTKICADCWFDLPNHYNCDLDAFVIMPNHIHGIIYIVETGLKPVSTIKRYSLSEIIRGFKTYSARKINEFQNTEGKSFWQSRFYEHIIRNEADLKMIQEYIVNNPYNWKEDRNNITVETGLKPVSTNAQKG